MGARRIGEPTRHLATERGIKALATHGRALHPIVISDLVMFLSTLYSVQAHPSPPNIEPDKHRPKLARTVR